MRYSHSPKPSLLVVAAAMVLAAVVLACPLSMMAHAQMTHMMGQDMATQGMSVMCPMLCGVPPDSAAFKSSDFDLGLLPVYLDLNPTSTIRPIFHPPTLA